MSTKANKTMIGAFVVGAVVLAVAAVLVFGSGMLFSPRQRVIMFFESSVSGLTVGSPVLFRGVPIGSVTDIGVDADSSTLRFTIPVVIEILGGKIRPITKRGIEGDETLLAARKEKPAQLLHTLVGKGLRAQLVTQSFVTGQLAVSLDFLPDTPAKLLGDQSLPEIPTVPSAFEALSNTLKSLPLQELVGKLINAVGGVDKLVNSPQLEKLPASLDATLAESRELLRDVRSKVAPLAASLESAVQNYSELAKRLDKRSEGLSGAAEKSLESFNHTLKDARQAMNRFEKVVSQDSPTVADLNKALVEVAAAARSLRALTDYLERHPEALLQGKGPNRR